MKLIKIYSNKNFKNTSFEDGFNAVVASAKSKKKEDTHNLGKTSLIKIIDFLLLTKIDRSKDKLFRNELFSGQYFCGEFLLNSGDFLIIKRSIDNPTKVSFKLNKSKLLDYVLDIDWDIQNMTFEKAKKQLQEYLSFDVLSSWSFRKSVTYFLRSQQDWLDVFKLNKFKGRHKDWKPFVFDLLGFNGQLIFDKLDLEDKIETLKKELLIIKREAQVDTEQQDKLKGLLDIKENELEEVKNDIDRFNFYQSDLEVNKRVVEELDLRIQALNTDRYRISYEIKKTKNSLSDIFEEIEVESIKKLYSDLEVFFPENLSKQYEDLICFQKKITIERKKILQVNLDDLEKEFSSVNIEINNFEKKKSEMLSILLERDSYFKFKEYQKTLTKVEVEIARINDKLEAIDKSLIFEKKISDYKEDVSTKIRNLKTEIASRKHSGLIKKFNTIIKGILDTNALLSLSQNKQGNVDFNADYQNKSDLLQTSEAEGTTYMKLLCVAFDLSILQKFRNDSFYRFAYHDGVLEGLDDRLKIRYIKTVKQICTENNIQYILTLIDSDLPKNNIDIISEKDICLRLHDEDENGKLFLSSF